MGVCWALAGSELCLRLTPGATQACLMLQNSLPSLKQPPLTVSVFQRPSYAGPTTSARSCFTQTLLARSFGQAKGRFPELWPLWPVRHPTQTFGGFERSSIMLRPFVALKVWISEINQVKHMSGRVAGLEAGLRCCHFPPPHPLQAACAGGR